MEHTKGKLIKQGNWIGFEGQTSPIALGNTDYDNELYAARIVECWNAHDKLVSDNKAMKEALELIIEYCSDGKNTSNVILGDTRPFIKARQALKTTNEQ